MRHKRGLYPLTLSERSECSSEISTIKIFWENSGKIVMGLRQKETPALRLGL